MSRNCNCQVNQAAVGRASADQSISVQIPAVTTQFLTGNMTAAQYYLPQSQNDDSQQDDGIHIDIPVVKRKFETVPDVKGAMVAADSTQVLSEAFSDDAKNQLDTSINDDSSSKATDTNMQSPSSANSNGDLDQLSDTSLSNGLKFRTEVAGIPKFTIELHSPEQSPRMKLLNSAGDHSFSELIQMLMRHRD